MADAAVPLFLPGWGAPAGLYDAGLPPGWTALQPPGFRQAGGSFDFYRRWLATEIRARDTRVVLGGHSMGAALAVAAAAEAPDRVERLLLIAPAGLPLTKPITLSLVDFSSQLARGRYPLRAAARAVGNVLAGPRSALGVARRVRTLDLSSEMQRIKRSWIPATVVGCVTDTLVTVRQCRETAGLLGATYRELDLPGGHMWMLGSWRALRAELAGPAAPVAG
jgi:pimeloyl-ACP methyl ester carboxylesterase